MVFNVPRDQQLYGCNECGMVFVGGDGMEMCDHCDEGMLELVIFTE